MPVTVRLQAANQPVERGLPSGEGFGDGARVESARRFTCEISESVLEDRQGRRRSPPKHRRGQRPRATSGRCRTPTGQPASSTPCQFRKESQDFRLLADEPVSSLDLIQRRGGDQLELQVAVVGVIARSVAGALSRWPIRRATMPGVDFTTASGSSPRK